MQSIVRDSARWALAGLATGTILAIAAAAMTGLVFSAAVTLTVIACGVGTCLGPLALIVCRAAQTGGAGRLAMGAAWGAGWGLALGLIYRCFYDNTFPLWHLALPIGVLAAAGLVNTALESAVKSRMEG